jgi:hypothetical protein
MSDRKDLVEETRRAYQEQESRTAAAFEDVVKRDSFGEILARVAENTLAVVKIGNDVADLVVRNLRIAGRRDITSLGRQLARTEDKLEMVLQEVERLQAQLDATRDAEARRNGARAQQAAEQS